ncbi:MAG: serine hydrolase domain-containing protein [Acidimicrobiia bacterium]
MSIIMHPNIDAIAVIDPHGKQTVYGLAKEKYRFASVTKVLSTLVFAELVESGFISFDTLIKDNYFTKGDVCLKDLLSHSSGIRPEYEEPIEPLTKRIYTNESFELSEKYIFSSTKYLEGYSISSIFEEGLKIHLNAAIKFSGSSAYGAEGTFEDLLALLNEIRSPTYISETTFNFLTTTYADGLPGILPGFGQYENNSFGIGFEVKGNKANHWMGDFASQKSYGHFGQSGAFIFHDPINMVSIALVSNKDFGPWAKTEYPKLSSEIYKEISL